MENIANASEMEIKTFDASTFHMQKRFDSTNKILMKKSTQLLINKSPTVLDDDNRNQMGVQTSI